MRILQVITSLHIGGAEKLIVDMVPLYQELGYQVDVLLFDGTETPFKRQLQDKGVTIYELGKGGSVYNPLYIFRLIPFLRKYDIVHTHNTSNRRRDWKCYKLLDKWMYSRYRSIICISDKAHENLCHYLGTSKSIKTIYNGIDLMRFQEVQADASFRNGKTVVTMVAGFRYQKDQDTLIKAFQYLPTEQYELWLVGDGERRSTLEDLVSRLGILENVRFWGIRSDIPVLLKSSDIIVMSSHFEGLSLSSIEGMAVDRPFIASDVDGLHEITKNAGILFPHGDAKALANIILRLKEEPYYRQIADRCQQRASKYDIRKTVTAYLEIYKQLV